MNKFIEVTESGQKVLIPISDIKEVRQRKKTGLALVVLRLPYRPIFFPPYDYVCCAETFEEVAAKIEAATAVK